jgi:integrase
MLKIAERATPKKIREVPFIEFQKEPDARKGFLEVDKFWELIGLLPTHLRPLITFLWDCGTRIGEALQIDWSQVNLDTRIIHLEPEQTKNSDARNLKMSSELHRLLTAVEPKTGLVFDGTNLRKEWTKACVACGLGRKIEVEDRPYDPRYEGLTLHDLRRSAVRDMVRAGVSETVAMKISGHKTRSVFDRYNITSVEDISNASDAVEISRMKRLTGKVLDGEKTVKKPVRSTRKPLMALSSRG